MTKIYFYNLGLSQYKEYKIDSEIEEFIYKTINNYIGNREEIEIIDDPLQLKHTILEWVNNGFVNLNQVTPLCNKIRGELKTRSVEAQRNLIIYLRAPKHGESFLYIIHTSQKMEIIDDDFKKIIEVGLGKGKILRIMQFSRLSIDSIQVSYREKYKSKLMVNLFHITSDRYESAGKVLLRGTFGSSLDFRIELTPTEFLNHINSKNIKFERDKHIKIFDRYDLLLEEIKYRNSYYSPTISKINDFIKEIKVDFDEFENLIEEFLMEYQSKKMQLGLSELISLDKFLTPDKFPDPESINIIEERSFVKFIINDNIKFKIKKPINPWGEFFVIDDLINFSTEYSKEIAHSILLGPLRNVRLIKVPLSKDPIELGQFFWYNYFEIPNNLRKILEIIQKEYKASDSDRKKRLLLIIMLVMLDKCADNFNFTKFSQQIYKDIIGLGVDLLSRDIVEGKFFEFKRGDILDPSNSLSERIKKVSQGIKPNLYTNGLAILIVGYDEDRNEITPINLNNYREEVCQEIKKGIITELSNQNLLIKIFLININNNRGLVIFNVIDKDFKDQIELVNLFE